MSYLKYIILIGVVAMIAAQDIDSMEEMEDLEAVEDLSTDSPKPELETGVPEEQKESAQDVTELNTDAPHPEEEMQDMPEESEGTPQSISETTAMKDESQTTEDQSTDDTSEESTLPSVIQASTDSEVAITSEYNGIDAKKNESAFSCYGRAFGQYADVQKECRVFHLCYPYFNSRTDELLYQRISFLCDNDSVFDQKRFICVDNSTVDHKCSESEDLFTRTNQEYLIRVFSQSVSPIDEMKGQPTQGSDRNWMSWLSGH